MNENMSGCFFLNTVYATNTDNNHFSVNRLTTKYNCNILFWPILRVHLVNNWSYGVISCNSFLLLSPPRKLRVIVN